MLTQRHAGAHPTDMDDRVRALNTASIRTGARYVLYWMQMNRRATCNHALEFAAGMANDLGLPLLCYEGLTCSYLHANDRIHTFILEGVPENARRLRERGAGYTFYLRRTRSDADDMLYTLVRDAAAVVTDDYPVFVAAHHNRSVPKKLDVPYYAVDASCVVPASLIETRQFGAYTIRPKIRRLLPQYLQPLPETRLKHRWRGPAPGMHTEVAAEDIPALVRSCEIDHTVAPSPSYSGGPLAAEQRLDDFLRSRLHRYGRDRNEPSARANSGLSPHLHFGRISALEVALAVRERAAREKLFADEFLEELIVRRELAFNFARFAARVDSLDELPAWAKQTLDAHRKDKREPLYSRDELAAARTHDPLWNATQNEMLASGTIASYYRMYWGKKIVEWSAAPEDALATMLHIHDRWALDGRDPNTYANCLWCFGLHDRPFRERPVFGKVRYMSYEGMRRKTDVEAYIRQVEGMQVSGPPASQNEPPVTGRAPGRSDTAASGRSRPGSRLR